MRIIHLIAVATLLSQSGCVWCQVPFDLRMEAINTRYTLQWNWTPDGHTHSACFTVQYKYSHQQGWNKSVCEGLCAQSYDLSTRLRFSGSYWLRVRAESGGQRSNWSQALSFTPEEDMLLGQPSVVEMKADVSMVMVQMMGPLTHDNKPMKHLMEDLTYRLQYWEKHTPEQRDERNYTDLSLLTLRELKPHTEYCLRVCVFSISYDKTSNYTHTQCMHTHGQQPVWQMALGVCVFVFVCVLLTLAHLLRQNTVKSPPKYLTPLSLQGPPLSHLSLLHLRLEPYSQVSVEMPVTMATSQKEREEEVELVYEWEGPGEERRGVCEDSGVYSGEDSSDCSIRISKHTHAHTNTHIHIHTHTDPHNSILASLVLQT